MVSKPPSATPAGPARLADAGALLDATLDAITEGILVIDENGGIVTFNRAFMMLWRIPERLAETADDNALIAFVLEQLQDPAAFVRKIMELYSEPEKESFDTLVFKDGRCFERRSAPRRVEGRPAGRVWSFRDITDLACAKEELSRAHSLLRATLDATADGILVVDLQGDLIDANRKVIEMWDIPSDIVATFDKKGLRKWVSAQVLNPEKFLRKVGEIYREPEGQSYDWVRFKDGRTFERYSMPLKIAGRVVGRVWSFRDVSDEKRMEEELRAARARGFTPRPEPPASK